MRLNKLTSNVVSGSKSLVVRRLMEGVVISAITVALGSCGTNVPSQKLADSQAQSSSLGNTGQLQIITTFLPITQFTKAVAGDRATVMQLLPTTTGPHDYQAKPEDVQKLAKANVLVQNGLEMEAFLDSLIKNAENANLKVIDSSQGVAAIATEAVEGQDPNHDHDHEEEKKGEAGHEHGKFNPHIWLDPKRVIRQVENIRDGLIAADPDGKSTYTANAATFIQQLKVLDDEATQQLKPFAGKTFVAFHDFAPYFAQSYNLKANFLVDVPEENPSPDDIKRVMTTVQQTHLKTLLTEPQTQPEVFSTLAQDLNVKVSEFDPMETGGSEALQPGYYLKTMRQNIKVLVQSFTGQSPQSSQPIWSWRMLAMLPNSRENQF